MESPTAIKKAKPGWMWRVGLFGIKKGREKPKILCFFPVLLTKSYILIWTMCKSQSGRSEVAEKEVRGGEL